MWQNPRRQTQADRYPEEWNRVVPFSNSVPHILLLRLFDEYNDEIWNAVTAMTPFHKLTYKLKIGYYANKYQLSKDNGEIMNDELKIH